MLAYQTRGSGARPLLLLHGFLGSGRNLTSLARHLCAADPDLRAVLVDLTGHGDSPPLPPGGDVATMAADVLALAEHLGAAAPLRVVGHSLGGRVALTMRLLAPARCGPAWILDIGPGPLGPLAGGLQEVFEGLLTAPARAVSRAAMRAHFTGRGVPGPLADWVTMNLQHDGEGFTWRIDREALQAARARGLGQDLWAALDVRPEEICLVRGGASDFVADAEADACRRRGVRVETLPGAGHFVHVDATEALTRLLLRP